MLLLRVVTVLAVMAAPSLAEHCGTLEWTVVKNQWVQVHAYGKGREEFGIHIFDKMFHDHPESRALFGNVNGDNIYSPQFKAHALRVIDGIDRVINNDGGVYTSDLGHLKEQHVPRNIPVEYWNWFEEELLDLAGEEIGLCFARDAWKHCLDDIFNHMH